MAWWDKRRWNEGANGMVGSEDMECQSGICFRKRYEVTCTCFSRGLNMSSGRGFGLCVHVVCVCVCVIACMFV